MNDAGVNDSWVAEAVNMDVDIMKDMELSDVSRNEDQYL